MSTNRIVAALKASHDSLAALGGQAGKDAAASLTPEEAERAGVLLAGLGHEAWACADRMRWYYETGPGADPAQAAHWKAVADRFAQAGSNNPGS
jgi:hypothetical protein